MTKLSKIKQKEQLKQSVALSSLVVGSVAAYVSGVYWMQPVLSLFGFSMGVGLWVVLWLGCVGVVSAVLQGTLALRRGAFGGV